jgi:hypothetical protein
VTINGADDAEVGDEGGVPEDVGVKGDEPDGQDAV